MNFLFYYIALVSFFSSIFGHPQCLDFRPPYKPKELKFCDEYSNYGCCGVKKDRRLNYTYSSIVNAFTSSKEKPIPKCLAVVKEVLCLRCHPYAAHVFDAEEISSLRETHNKRELYFPGLCRNFCLNAVRDCKQYLEQLVIHQKDFLIFLGNSSTTEFCKWAELKDKDYCHPNIQKFQEKQLKLEKIYKNKICVKPYTWKYFANALVAVHANDKSHRLFVGEQRGLVFVVFPNGTTLNKPFLNITGKIVNSGFPWDERGLLGLAFHPKYKENGRFFVYYSTSQSASKNSPSKGSREDHFVRISEYTVDLHNPNIADHYSELPIIDINQPEPNHNGGMLLFGDDGYLYIFVGDGGGSGDRHGRHGNGLNMSTLLGKALRIDIDSEHELYTIPKDNPFVKAGESVKKEIFASGLRNPWRCSIDRGNRNGRGMGRIFCGDVGQNRYEEIDIIQKGQNFGWRAFEANSCFDKRLCKRRIDNVTFPIMAYNHSMGRSIVGGYVYRGCKSPKLYGKYIFGDTMNGRLFVGVENIKTKKWSFEDLTIGDGNFCNNGLNAINNRFHILSFGETESGEVLMLSTIYPFPNNRLSLVYQLVDPTLRGNPEVCRFKIHQEKPLGSIERRQIFYTIQKKQSPS